MDCPPYPDDVRVFKPGTPLERAIEAGECHGYRIFLRAGELLEVTAEQVGADVAVALRDPAGCPVVEVDSPNGPRGPERLFAVAEEEGGYALEVERPSRYGSEPGSYKLAVTRRKPTAQDVLRAAASRRRAESGFAEEGIEALEQAADLWAQTGEPYLEAATWLEIALKHWIRRSYEEALEAFEAADRRISSLDAWEFEPSLLNARGDALRASGEFVSAQRELEQALVASRAVRNPWQEAAALANLGLVQQDRREVWVALGFFDRALELFKHLGDMEQVAQVLQVRGQLLNWLGRERQAEEDLETSLSMLRTLGARAEIAESLLELGWLEDSLGHRQLALRRIEEAQAIYRELGLRQGEAVCQDRLGSIYLTSERFDDAQKAHTQAIRGFQKEGDRRGEAHARNNLGRVLREVGNLPEALATHEDALGLFEELGDPSGVAHALTDRARVRQLEGNLHKALEDAQAALAHLEGIRTNTRSPTWRSQYLATVHEHYQLTVELLMELESREPQRRWSERAFEVADQSHARSLLDLVTGLEGEQKRKEAPDALLAGHAELSRAIRAQRVELLRLIAQNAPDGKLTEASRRLDDLILKWEHREGLVLGTDGVEASISRRSLAEIREVLAPETSLLMFSLGERRSFVWLVRPEELIARELPPRREIESAVEAVLEEVKPAGGLLFAPEASLRSLDRAGNLLLGSLPQRALTRRLVVVPDGVLHRLPYSALRLDGRHLVQDHEIVRVPSASVLVSLRERHDEHGEPSQLLALMADPVFQSDDERLPDVPPAGTEVPHLKISPIVENLPRLRASGLEADAIAELVRPTCRWTARDFEASRESVERGRLTGFHLIHLATHAVLDDERPETSGIVLSGFDQQARPREGYLYAFEIADLELDADLVVLSACRTGLGHEIRGEGLVGLTQSFLEAGADRVLVSLWNVDDAATAELMEHFYWGLLRERFPPTEALRRAQERLRRSETWSDPYYWAGFTLVGDWGELPSTLLTSPCLHS